MFEAVRREISEIYTGRGQLAYGLEGISQLAHALQTAEAAEGLSESPTFILAALLHDIGQMTNGLGENPAASGIDNRHEHIGAQWLAARLPEAVAEPVRLHVEAKRFLCGTDSAYAATLAPDSVLSLRLQGEPMDAEACRAFLRRPFAEEAVRLRRLDDAAKLRNKTTPPLEHFLSYLSRLDPIDAAVRSTFGRMGFVVLRSFFSDSEQCMIADVSTAFGLSAVEIIRRSLANGTSLAAHAQNSANELIVVAEARDPTQVCRFEYLLGSRPDFAAFVRARILPVVSSLAGEPYLPFKDKENEKHAGGGAFGPHQDYAAYQAFGPRYNVTAMVSVDRQTIENGCLSFATNLAEVAHDSSFTGKWIEGRPLLHFNIGGPRNGDICDAAADKLTWTTVETEPGDLVIFDSFVPHRSTANRSRASRRAMFLTFNPAREGDWYQRYYADKRANYADAKFHVSTPTARG